MSASLAAASQVRFVGMEGDGDTATLLQFQVPPFGAVVRELFQQQKLLDDACPTPMTQRSSCSAAPSRTLPSAVPIRIVSIRGCFAELSDIDVS